MSHDRKRSQAKETHQRQRKRLDSLRDAENPFDDYYNEPRHRGRQSEEFNYLDEQQNDSRSVQSNVQNDLNADEEDYYDSQDNENQEPAKDNNLFETVPSPVRSKKMDNNPNENYPRRAYEPAEARVSEKQNYNKNVRDHQRQRKRLDSLRDTENPFKGSSGSKHYGRRSEEFNLLEKHPKSSTGYPQSNRQSSFDDDEEDNYVEFQQSQHRQVNNDHCSQMKRNNASPCQYEICHPRRESGHTHQGNACSITIKSPRSHGSGSRKIEVTVPMQCKPKEECQQTIQCSRSQDTTKCKARPASCRTTSRKENPCSIRPKCNPRQPHPNHCSDLQVEVDDTTCREKIFPFYINADGNYEIKPNMVIFQNDKFAVIVADPHKSTLGVQEFFKKPDCGNNDFDDFSPRGNRRNPNHFRNHHGHHSKENRHGKTSSSRNSKSPHLPPPPPQAEEDAEYFSEDDKENQADADGGVEIGNMTWSKEQIDSAKLIQSTFRGYIQRKRYIKQREIAINAREWDKQVHKLNDESWSRRIDLQPVKKLTIDDTEAIIIFGGWNPGKKWSGSNNGREFFQYNLRTREWSKDLGIMPQARAYFGAVYISKSIIVFGGSDLSQTTNIEQDYPVSTTWRLDLSTGLWEILSDMNIPRCRFGYAMLRNKIYVFGGLGENGRLLNSCEMYDPSMDAWSLLPSMQIPRMCMGVSKVDNEICITGGKTNSPNEPVSQSVDLFQPDTNSFTNNVSSLPHPRSGHTLVQYGHKVFALGGVTKRNIGDFEPNLGTDICEYEDKKWKNVNNLKIKRHDHCQVKIDHYAILFGGITYPTTEASNTVEIVNLDKSSSSSVTIRPMPRPLSGHVGLVLPITS